jgi:hypothetical protein
MGQLHATCCCQLAGPSCRVALYGVSAYPVCVVTISLDPCRGVREGLWVSILRSQRMDMTASVEAASDSLSYLSILVLASTYSQA